MCKKAEMQFSVFLIHQLAQNWQKTPRESVSDPRQHTYPRWVHNKTLRCSSFYGRAKSCRRYNRIREGKTSCMTVYHGSSGEILRFWDFVEFDNQNNISYIMGKQNVFAVLRHCSSNREGSAYFILKSHHKTM